eukprot:10507122-Karenia_brevis.AAC.1
MVVEMMKMRKSIKHPFTNAGDVSDTCHLRYLSKSTGQPRIHDKLAILDDDDDNGDDDDDADDDGDDDGDGGEN